VKILGVEVDRGAGRGRLGRLLARDAELRDVFAGDPARAARLHELQRWQSARLMKSHADLRATPRYRQAVEFFFDELYGGGDPRGRDRDLARVQRVMERLLPKPALEAMCLAIELEVLAQDLDADVVRALPPGPITVANYARAYRGAGRTADRERQIELLGVIGGYLDGVVRKPFVHGLVRLARGPAHAAGFGVLQEFLERGLNAFLAMDGADEFLAIIRDRETLYMRRMLDGRDDPFDFGRDEPVAKPA
jgi:hypothetical protein